jgi:hypothetical protein
MSRGRGFAVFALCVFAALMSTGATGGSASRHRSTGTFSDLHYNEEGGDLLGTEVRIVRIASGYEATVQFAEGAPGDLYLVRPTIQGDSIQFDLPAAGSDTGHFAGRIGDSYLTGSYSRSTGSVETLKLPRRKSYWD